MSAESTHKSDRGLSSLMHIGTGYYLKYLLYYIEQIDRITD